MEDYKPSPNWWLTKITEQHYRDIYKGTDGMDVIELFRNPPKDDDDYFTNYFTSRLFRLCSGLYKIEDKQGNLVPFEMNWAQHSVYSAYLTHPRIIILKSRQQRHKYNVVNNIHRHCYHKSQQVPRAYVAG